MTSLFNYFKKKPHHSSEFSEASEVNSDPQPLGFNLIGVSNLAKASFPILVTGSAFLMATPIPVAAQSVVYDNTTTAAINSNTCISSPIVRTFNVTDNFTVQDVNLGFNADHTSRNDLRVTLQHPDGTSVQVISNTSSSANGFDVLLDSNSGNSLDDGDNDDTAAPLYDRTAAPSNSLDAFNGKTSNGTWTLKICDSGFGDEGTFNSARLVLDGIAITTPATRTSCPLIDALDNQVDLDFETTAPTVISGTADQVGAVYRFSNVASGIDALVTVQQLSPTSTNVNLLGNGLSGNITDSDGSFQYKVDLVNGGTSIPIAPIDIVVIALDIDGDPERSTLSDFIEFINPNGYFINDPTQLQESTTINSVKFVNTNSGFNDLTKTDPEYGGGAFYENTNSFIVRAGVQNANSPAQRGIFFNLKISDLDQFTSLVCTPFTPYLDYGDAPDTTPNTGNGDYQTLSSNSGPSHTLDNTTYLGAGVTGDTDGFGDGTDNNNNATDDTDDGVKLNSATLQGQRVTRGDTVTLDITTAGFGVLNAWIDWNADGDFDETDEQIATDVSPSANAIALELTVPAGASIGNTYARFRYSSDTGLTPTGRAGDGEVEDYQITIAIPEELSPEAGNIVINEVLYAQTGNSADTNDEFIELYNSSDNAVDISNWRLADSNLLINDTDNIGNITGDAANPAYIFPNNTTLQPGEYAVIWIGNNTSDHQAADAAFQDWLGNARKLNNAGEDIWLYDDELKIVDYIAYGSDNAINTPPSAGLNLWDDTYQGDLDGAATRQSISLTPNGEDGNTSACWEHTLSNDADGRCTGFLETRDTDTVGVRQTSVGVYNNVLPNVILVKRITAIKPKDTNQWIELPESGSPFIDGIDGGSSENNVGSERAADDNDPNWPNPDVYLRGLINSGKVMPGDELEYTVYFLSNGSNDAKNLRICDRVPSETTFIPDSFNATAGFPSSDVGIALFQSNTSLPNGGLAEPNIFLTNIPDSDRGRYYGPGTSVPSGCNVTFNQNGVVVVEVGDVPNADSPGNPPNSYGFIRFRALVK